MQEKKFHSRKTLMQYNALEKLKSLILMHGTCLLLLQIRFINQTFKTFKVLCNNGIFK